MDLSYTIHSSVISPHLTRMKVGEAVVPATVNALVVELVPDDDCCGTVTIRHVAEPKTLEEMAKAWPAGRKVKATFSPEG